MRAISIEGGKKLRGTVHISGAKNASLPQLAASILTPETILLENVPRVADVDTMKSLLITLGAELEEDSHRIKVKFEKLSTYEAPYALTTRMRASVLLLGPMLARFGVVKMARPGGCPIGRRPINFHLEGLRKMGAEVVEEGETVVARAERLRGARIRFPRISVTGTENIMMAAVLAKGETLIENPAMEPEVVDLYNMLKKMGAEMEWNRDGIHIQGVSQLRGTSHRVIPDRIEAGTFAVAAAVAGEEVEIKGAEPSHMEAVLEKLREAGVEMEVRQDSILVRGRERFFPLHIETKEYPGFPTDMQAQFMVLLSFADGTSTIKETIFENRFRHVAELNKMGTRIRVDGNTAIIEGIDELRGAEVVATDLRASACLVLAGLVAEGTTVVRDIHHLERGYEDFFEKLKALGATIKEEGK